MDTFCDGGFPTFNIVTENLVHTFDDIQLKYIDKYMCTSNCPCISVDKTQWGDRMGDLSSRNFSGTYSTFSSCYNDLVNKNTISSIDSSVLTLLKSFENNIDCSGLCTTPLFWFYNDVS